MPHNFRKHLTLNLTTGSGGVCVFVSKAGNNANDGLTPDTPKKTITAALAVAKANVIIGAGVYAESSLFVNNKTLHADGTVALRGLSTQTCFTPGGNNTLNDLIIFGYQYVVNYTAGSFSINRSYLFNTNVAASTGASTRMEDCVLRNINITETNLTSGNSNGNYALNCTLISCTGSFHLGFNLSYASADCVLSLWSTFTNGVTINAFNSFPATNNLQGPFSMNGTSYASLAAQKAAAPTININSISADPYFNRPEADNYTLKIESPNLDLGIGPKNLGYSEGYYFAIDPSVQPGDLLTTETVWLQSTRDVNARANALSVTNLTINAARNIILPVNTSGVLEGELVFDKLKVSDQPVQITRLGLDTGLNFDTDFPNTENLFNSNNPQILNNNVPSYENYASGDAGRNPHRLAIRARWSQKASPNLAVDTDWITGNSFLLFEPYTTMSYNPTTVVGNGQPSYDLTPANVASVQLTHIQLKIRLRSNYFSK